MRLESISIPRNTSRVVGPSSLSGAKGMPRWSVGFYHGFGLEMHTMVTVVDPR
ncbi:hypothetical protein OS493_038830, partial [Desmophyllum pertusum]